MKKRFSSYEEYASYFSSLIRLEREAQRELHLKEIKTLTGKERERRGRALLGLRARKLGRGLGGFYLVRYERREPFPKTEISVGDVVLVSRGRPTGREVQATVAEKGRNYLVLAFPDEPPPYALGRSVRVDLFSNEVTFKRMEEALRRVKEHPLLKRLLGLK
ncbi:MAG: hypothetical protein GXO03_03965 [Aquificae bacterium]|nr:hypothetical protein [Aquificota bacterium]